MAPECIVRKGGLKAGDALILTRPLGTGVLFAGAMRARANAAWIEAALAAMRQSNRAAAAILRQHGAAAMTDVTGFGLIGHLGEMLAASLAGAELDPAAVPLYPGALALAQAGICSTLLPENITLASLLRGEVDAPLRALLFDPQTSGGLLAGVPADRAAACVMALRSNGYVHATIVGRVTGTVGSAQRRVDCCWTREPVKERVRPRAPFRFFTRASHATSTFLNCHGSSVSTSSGNSAPRPCNGVQSV